MTDYKRQGKRNLASGRRFEAKVRADLEKSGWYVSKWQNNVSDVFEQDIGEYVRKLIPAKQGRFRKTSTGFPDFIAFIKVDTPKVPGIINYPTYFIKGVEAKSNGYLSKEEKEKCRWLLDQNVFSYIMIAKKGKKRGKIEYEEFKE